jgi:tRNA pseudouridine55 synthase
MNGWLLLDKPPGISSSQALSPLRKLRPKVKVGHTGTLDPFASGLLLIGLGEATKLINYAMDDKKEYTFTMHWGESRDTLDCDGNVTFQDARTPTAEQIIAVIPSFIGDIQQEPPAFSALKVNGKRAYNLARAGEKVVLAARSAHCYSLTLEKHQGDKSTFKLLCGKGFYVRSLARDIANKLGFHAYVYSLRRTRLGKFNVENAITLDYLQNLVHNAVTGMQLIKSCVLSMDTVLDDILVQEVSTEAGKLLHQGQKLSISGSNIVEGQVVAAKADGQLIAMCVFTCGALKPVRVFNH